MTRSPLRPGRVVVATSAVVAALALVAPVSANAAGAPVSDPDGILNLPAGLSYQILATAGETQVKSTESGQTFDMPEDADANLVVPVRAGKPSKGSYLLTVHELTKPVTGDYQGDVGKPAVPEQATADDRDSDGWGSITRLKLAKDGRTVKKSEVITTGLHNLCAGASTPWKTFLVNEEFPFRSDPEFRSGWVWEVNPYTGKATRLTGMGRLSHEDEIRVGKNWYLTEDMGGDAFVYKFVPNKAKDLRSGKLYGLMFNHTTKTGVWVGPLDPTDPRGDMINNWHVDPAVHGFDKLEGITQRAGRLVFSESGSKASDTATPAVDSPGRVWAIRDGAAGVTGSVLVEGDFAKLSHPDNVTFTPAGDLMIMEDNGSALTRDPATGKAANGAMNEVYILPKGKRGADDLKLLATVPNGGEPTGPAFSRNGKLLYVSIQGDPSRSLVISGHNWKTRYAG